MNDDARNEDTDRPFNLNNEANPDTAIFSGAAPDPTATVAAAAASTIVPNAHITPSGKKQHTNPFSSANMKNMAKKDTTDTK